MNLENQAKESPIEKAKRLKAEKEAKDSNKKETESQAKTEKLDALNNSKQDLENKLDEINTQIEASRSEAHETRDTMKEADLDKDEEFKGEYDSTISEVAGSLNELRNERNKIKAELEQINSDIENFGVNEAIAEGKEATQEAVENVNQGNEETVAQVESYPGADAKDVEAAKEVVTATNQEVSAVVKSAEGKSSEVKVYENDKEYSNKTDSLYKENLQLDAQLDYAFLKKDIANFQKLLIQKFENEIKRIELDNQRMKENELIQKASNPSYDRSSNIKSNEGQIQSYKERIEFAQKNVTNLYEYNARVDGSGPSANEKINGFTPSQLVYKYYQEIERFNDADQKHFAPGNKGTQYPHKFDKLNGLIDIAKQEKDNDTISSIKKLNLEYPEEIKAKLAL